MDKNDPARPFLVLAHHRSGSNFVNDLLQAHPCIDCINEPFSMHTPFFRQCDLEPWTAADFDARYLHRSLAPHDALRDFLAELRQHLLNSGRWRTLGFKETGLFSKLQWMQAFIPSLRVVFVRRDPHAIVSSVLRSGLADLWHYRSKVPPAFRALWPHYASDASEDERDAELAAMSIAVRYALAQRTLQAFEHVAVRLEDFLCTPETQLRTICGFLGHAVHRDQLDFLDERQAVSRGGRYSSFRSRVDVQRSWRAHLTPRQIAVTDAVMDAAGATVCTGTAPAPDVRHA